jgi:hypothetical protein
MLDWQRNDPSLRDRRTGNLNDRLWGRWLDDLGSSFGCDREAGRLFNDFNTLRLFDFDLSLEVVNCNFDFFDGWRFDVRWRCDRLDGLGFNLLLNDRSNGLRGRRGLS